jgi:hypothetical protein
MLAMEVVRAALMTYLEDLPPRKRAAFIARFARRLGASKVTPIRGKRPDASAMEWLNEHLGELLGGI